MKSILISINPEWVAKILNGEKTIEIRKTAPKCELPVDVYIYCTKGGALYVMRDMLKENCYKATYGERKHKTAYKYDLSGHIVAKFTLNEVEELYLEPYIYDSRSVRYKSGVYKGEWKDVMERYSCLNENRMDEYLGNGSKFYAWHIDDLKIFDEPKVIDGFGLKRAPQSWQYAAKGEE